MKQVKKVLVCILLLTALVLCSCARGEYVPTEDAEYELKYQWGALVLKENGRTVDSWPVREVCEISGMIVAHDIVVVRGEDEVRAFFKDVFGDGVALTLTTEAAIDALAPIPDRIRLAYEDDDPTVIPVSEANAEATFITFALMRGQLPMAFMDRYGNYYVSDAEELSSKTLYRYFLDHFRSR